MTEYTKVLWQSLPRVFKVASLIEFKRLDWYLLRKQIILDLLCAVYTCSFLYIGRPEGLNWGHFWIEAAQSSRVWFFEETPTIDKSYQKLSWASGEITFRYFWLVDVPNSLAHLGVVVCWCEEKHVPNHTAYYTGWTNKRTANQINTLPFPII